MKLKDYLERLVIEEYSKLIVKILVGSSIFSAIVIAVYIILLIHNQQLFSVPHFIQILVGCISIPTFLITAVQISNYLYHAKYQVKNEQNAKSIGIAKQYAQNIIAETSFVHNVLVETIDETDYRVLRNNVPEYFTLPSFEKQTVPIRVTEIFKNAFSVISVETIEKNVFLSNIFKSDDLIDTGEKSSRLKREYNRRFRGTILNTLNMLEWFAMEINNNVADGEVLYDALHHTFLQFVEEVYPIICIRNQKTQETLYKNVIILYKKWNNKYIEEERKVAQILNRQ